MLKAQHRMTNATVAVKVIDKLKHHSHLAAIERELKLLRSLVSLPTL